MNIFSAEKIINRLHKMLDNAMTENPVETGFDETKMSALETKLARFLAVSTDTKAQLADEKTRISGLISDISHQTQTPISNILLYSQLLEECDLAPQEKEYASLLIEQTQKLSFLVSTLVTTSRLESGIVAVKKKREAVQRLFDSTFASAMPFAKSKGVELCFEQTEVTAIFDLKWTAEALYNIVDNAIKYTKTGGSVKVSAISYELFCRIDIEDSGIGISEDELAKIFTRFFRSPEVSDEKGVGLGLYLARNIVTSEGGYIKVSSQKGKGSVFSIFLSMSQ